MADTPTVVSLGKSDADQAAEFKARAVEVLKPLLDLMGEAHRAGMAIQFDGIGVDAFGRFNANGLRIVKVFA